MRKIAEKLLNEKKITQEEFDQVKDLTKEALFGEGGGAAAKQILQALGLGTIAVGVGSQLAEKINRMIQQSSAYSDMMKKVPILTEYPEEDVKDYYNVVKTFSPKAASNPLVAGALVNKMIQFGGVDHKLVQDLASLEGDKKDILTEIAIKAGGSLAQFPKDDE
jgi:hypothetical protein